MIRTRSLLQFVATAGMLTAGLAATAHADYFQVTAAAPGVQSPVGTTNYFETFNNAIALNGSFVTTFANSGVIGTYSGSGLAIENQAVWGGAGATGKYISATSGGSFTLTLSSPVNYFGLWDSALDLGNQISFYSGTTLLYSFTPNSFITLVGACPSTSGYCGNPNSTYTNSTNDNTGQQYAYLNFYDSNGTFNKVVFSETAGSGEFESDNHAVATISSAPGGLLISAVPEPSSTVLVGTGVLGGLGFVRVRRRRA